MECYLLTELHNRTSMTADVISMLEILLVICHRFLLMLPNLKEKFL